MLQGYAVCIAREAQTPAASCSTFRRENSLILQACRPVASENAVGLLGGEAIMTCRNRCVGSEDAFLTDLCDVGFVAAPSGPPPNWLSSKASVSSAA